MLPPAIACTELLGAAIAGGCEEVPTFSVKALIRTSSNSLISRLERAACLFSKKDYISPDLEVPPLEVEVIDLEVSEPKQSPQRRFERKYPPLGIRDTFICHPQKGFQSKHGQIDIFTELSGEIVFVHEYIAEESLSSSEHTSTAQAYKSDDGHWVIQQKATRACAAAVAAMLIKDNDGIVDIVSLHTYNLANDADVLELIKESGLISIYTEEVPFKSLKRAIEKNGSAIITVNCVAGSHYLVLDAIKEGYATIRDPYHGWQIDITLHDLRKVYGAQGNIIQCILK